MIYKSKKSKKWKGSLLLTPIALMHTPHLDSHKHPRTDGGLHRLHVLASRGTHQDSLKIGGSEGSIKRIK